MTMLSGTSKAKTLVSPLSHRLQNGVSSAYNLTRSRVVLHIRRLYHQSPNEAAGADRQMH